MKNIVILGAGTGGTLMANLLSTKLDMRQWQISIIDNADYHIYQPGLLFIPYRLYNYADAGDVTQPINYPFTNAVTFIKAEVKLIDHHSKKIETDNGVFTYDWLISAMGCQIAPDEIEGMENAMGTHAHTFYTLDGALHFQNALDIMHTGHLVINIADVPIKCQVAPIESALLADYYFCLKGIRSKIDITLVVPTSKVFTKPVANSALSMILEDKHINVVPNFSLASLDSENKVIHAFEGSSVEYDLLCVIPPNLGPAVIDDSGLGDGTGFALTDPRTLKSRKADYIYFIGDNTNVATSKASSVAHFESETVVENLLREIAGKQPLATFDGHASCFIETGFKKSILIDFNYDMEPLPGAFPSPVGPFSLLKETLINHMGKMAFKKVYWNLLLTGRLSKAPFLSSHMSFVGKDMTKMPQSRRAKAMFVKDVMTKDVITVKQGTPLEKAARLLTDHKLSGLPVVNVDNQLIGILTEADFLSAINVGSRSIFQRLFATVLKNSKLSKHLTKKVGTRVEDIMTKKTITLTSDDTLQKAVQLIETNHIKRIVIIDKKSHVIGIVSRADLIKIYLLQG